MFRQVDRSILGANSFLEKFGYKFLSIDLQVLERDFSGLFALPKSFHSEKLLSFKDGKNIISSEFRDYLITQ